MLFCSCGGWNGLQTALECYLKETSVGLGSGVQSKGGEGRGVEWRRFVFFVFFEQTNNF